MGREKEHSPHIPELQSLRGIAAVLVMVHHSVRTLSSDGWVWRISESPLNGGGAVILFFVLSGFVLGQSILRRGVDRKGLTVYYTRRLFRIYPALWLGTALGVGYLLVIQPIGGESLAAWMTRHYQPANFTVSRAARSVLGLDNYLLPTSWTITVEIAASIVLPLIIIAFSSSLFLTIVIISGLAFLGLATGQHAIRVPFHLVYFALGAALACGRWPIEKMTRIHLLAASLVLLFAPIFFSSTERAFWALCMVEGLASTVLVAGIAAKSVRWMRWRPLVLIGDWSYSIYILHLPIAYTVARLLDGSGLIAGNHNGWALAIAAITALVTIPLSAVVYRFIERPGIKVGDRLLASRRQ